MKPVVLCESATYSYNFEGLNASRLSQVRIFGVLGEYLRVGDD